jgi:large subunit ribosomal protein L6
MSKIGRKAIDLGAVNVEIKGQEIHYKGKKASGVYVLPDVLTAHLKDNKLVITPQKTKSARLSQREINRIWGLHRALLANKIRGADHLFEKEVLINGLGFKAAVAGQKVTFNLGYSHKIDFELPKDVSLEIDKTGQKLTFKSPDKFLIGHVCSLIRALRPPEPYKGTGIKLASEVIARKAGKTKAAA